MGKGIKFCKYEGCDVRCTTNSYCSDDHARKAFWNVKPRKKKTVEEAIIEETEITEVKPELEKEHLWKLVDIAITRYPKAMEGLETLDEKEEKILTDSVLLQKCNSIYVVYLLGKK